MRTKLTATQKLIKAEEAYLLEFGWEKVHNPMNPKAAHWMPPSQVGHVFPGDRVFREVALEAQKAVVNFPSY